MKKTSLRLHPNSQNSRRALFGQVKDTCYDVAIIGGGISGARIFHKLREEGFRVLLVDRGDFACGTSQASGMMLWGGLLYLKDLDVLTVRKLCKARDRMIEQLPDQIQPQSLCYIPRKQALRSQFVVLSAMFIYWLLGSYRRPFPKKLSNFPENALLHPGAFRDSLTVEEAMLKTSDCRFTFEWILQAIGKNGQALNHCSADEFNFDTREKRWRLKLRDCLEGVELETSAKFVINAAGVWTDELNKRLQIGSPYRHMMSKGVYINIKRPDHLKNNLIFDTGSDGDAFTFVPWGPVALCGPTETDVKDLREGFRITPEDVRFLLKQTNYNVEGNYGPDDIVSMRCGMRPLAVKRNFSKKKHSLALSRKHLIHADRTRNAIAVYGGKLTSSGSLADQVYALLKPERAKRKRDSLVSYEFRPSTEAFPGLEDPVLSATWCRDREHCHTMDDYLRRRTNIAQWIPRRGLGRDSENAAKLQRIARVFAEDQDSADEAFTRYDHEVQTQHDNLLASI